MVSKIYKRIIGMFIVIAVSVGILFQINELTIKNVSASNLWNSYFGASEGWYEGAEGKLTKNSVEGFTATIDKVGWGGVWGGQVWKKLDNNISKGKNYTLSFRIKASNVQKYVYILVGNSYDIAYSTWIYLPANQIVDVSEQFVAEADADTIWFGLGGDVGDREEVATDIDASIRYEVFEKKFGKSAQSALVEDANGDFTAAMVIEVSEFEVTDKIQIKKSDPYITANSRTVIYGAKPFNINAKTNGDGQLTYSSSDNKVATVNKDGKVTVKGYGKATITIKASETEQYNSATKKIIIKVIPKKVILKKAISQRKKQFKATWKKDASVTGYQVYCSTNKNFKRNTYVRTYNKNITKMSIIALKSKKTYYIKIRSYKKVGKSKYYGEWSKVKKVKIK